MSKKELINILKEILIQNNWKNFSKIKFLIKNI